MLVSTLVGARNEGSGAARGQSTHWQLACKCAHKCSSGCELFKTSVQGQGRLCSSYCVNSDQGDNGRLPNPWQGQSTLQNSTLVWPDLAQHSTARHGTAQHGTARHSAAQHSTAQHSTAQHSTAQHSTAQSSTVQHGAAQCSQAQHSMVQHSTAQPFAAQHSTIQHGAAKHSMVQQSAAQHRVALCSTAQYTTARCNPAQGCHLTQHSSGSSASHSRAQHATAQRSMLPDRSLIIHCSHWQKEVGHVSNVDAKLQVPILQFSDVQSVINVLTAGRVDTAYGKVPQILSASSRRFYPW